MITIVNFAHPLSEKAGKQIREALGDEFQEKLITFHLDMSAPIAPQIDRILQDSGTFDLYVPPSLGVAAAYIAKKMPDDRFIVIRRDDSGLFSEYVFSEVL